MAPVDALAPIRKAVAVAESHTAADADPGERKESFQIRDDFLDAECGCV